MTKIDSVASLTTKGTEIVVYNKNSAVYVKSSGFDAKLVYATHGKKNGTYRATINVEMNDGKSVSAEITKNVTLICAMHNASKKNAELVLFNANECFDVIQNYNCGQQFHLKNDDDSDDLTKNYCFIYNK